MQWTERAQADLAAIRAFIETDSPHYASVTVRRILHPVDRLQDFPQSGRVVPEYVNPAVREVVLRPYRIVYRIVSADEIQRSAFRRVEPDRRARLRGRDRVRLKPDTTCAAEAGRYVRCVSSARRSAWARWIARRPVSCAICS